MRHLITVVSMCLLSCSDPVRLTPFCGNFGEDQCYAVWTEKYKDPHFEAEEKAKLHQELAQRGLLGTCRMGTPTCDEDYNIIDCEGAVYPTNIDGCGGGDSNCNGETDEDFNDTVSIAWRADNNPCPSRYGVCQWAAITCNLGQLTCNLPNTYEKEEKSCDGLDNDCDILIDEVDPLGGCFDDEFWKATNPPCHLGVNVCVNGGWVCTNQQLPTTEICNRIDDDCNGIIDDTGALLSYLYDIVFVIDTSGSMCSSISAVAGGLLMWLEQFETEPNFRWAVVLMTYQSGNLVETVLDFTDLASVQVFIANIGCNGSGYEASRDALFEVCSHSNSTDAQLSWRSNANAMLFSFTDEYPQSYAATFSTDTMIIDACIDNSVLPFQWSRHPALFGPIVTAASGLHFQLPTTPLQLFDNLNSIVITLCEEAP